MTASTLGAEETLTPADLDRARLYLRQTESGIAGVIKGLSDAQWIFKPSAAEWSIGEIMDHIIFVQERVLGPIREQLATAAAPPDGYDHKTVDDLILYRFPNRLVKFPSPHTPSQSISPAEGFERVLLNYRHLETFLQSTPDLRQHVLEGPPLKAVSNGAYQWMDGYHWILAVAAHTERHTKQILEVRADYRFPAN